MQIDSPTMRRLRDLLLERAGLREPLEAQAARPPLDERSAEVRALTARVGPICEVLYLVMVADGEADAKERDSIRGAIATLTAGGLSERSVEAMLDDFASAAAQCGRHERLQQVAGRLSADREDAESALALAAAVALADERVAGDEERLLQELSRWLGISGERAAVILDTVD